MANQHLAFIGAGNIARAIIGGLVSSGYETGRIAAADPSREQLQSLPEGITAGSDNRNCASGADVVVLCVKPNLATRVAADIAPVAKNKLIISVAAGIPMTALQGELGDDAAIIRCMPNTPALVGAGMTGLYANERVKPDQREVGEAILAAVGKILWFDDEGQLDMVTAVSGSGPAYFFLVMEAMEKAAMSLGLPADASRTLVLQTALGAAQMAAGSDDSPETLRRRVTSPGGTTEAAINCLNDAGLSAIFETAIQAACLRSRELATTTGA